MSTNHFRQLEQNSFAMYTLKLKYIIVNYFNYVIFGGMVQIKIWYISYISSKYPKIYQKHIGNRLCLDRT